MIQIICLNSNNVKEVIADVILLKLHGNKWGIVTDNRPVRYYNKYNIVVNCIKQILSISGGYGSSRIEEISDFNKRIVDSKLDKLIKLPAKKEGYTLNPTQDIFKMKCYTKDEVKKLLEKNDSAEGE